MPTVCVYKITSEQNPDVCYVGSSTHFSRRKARHREQLRGVTPQRVHRYFIDSGETPVFTILERFDEPMTFKALAEHEHRWFELLKPNLNTYRPMASNELVTCFTCWKKFRTSRIPGHFSSSYHLKRKREGTADMLLVE